MQKQRAQAMVGLGFVGLGVLAAGFLLLGALYMFIVEVIVPLFR
jgi:hypothetical protein